MSAWVPVRDPAARTGVGAVAVGLLRPRFLRQQRHPGPLLLERGQGRRSEPARARSRPAAGGFGELSDASQCLAPGMEVGGGRDVGGDHLARSLAGTRAAVRGRHAGLPFAGAPLSFWCFSSEPVAAAALPRVQIADGNSGFSAPLELGANAPAIPAGRWIQVRIPLRLFRGSSPRAFDPRTMQTLSFLQGASDDAGHKLAIDEIRIDDARPSDRVPGTPQGLRAKGYERHIDLSWDAATGAERYVVYRSADGKDYVPVGTDEAGSHRYADFLGAPDRKAFYRVTASNRDYRESPPSAVVSAATRPMTDDEMLNMLQEACFRYFWEGGHAASGMALENIPGDPNLVATGASGFGILALRAGADRGFPPRAGQQRQN